MRGRWLLVLIIVGALGGGGWWFFGRGSASAFNASSGELAVKWRGKYAGSMALPATLNWCPVSHVGVLEAVSGDTGTVIVLYETDALTSGAHPVISPDAALATPRPSASAAMRWMRTSPDTAVTGFRSESGTVRIQFADGKASGDINARLRGVSGVDTVVIQGAFRGIAVVTTARGCT